MEDWEWNCMAAAHGDVDNVTTRLCRGCHEFVRVPRGFYADWQDVMDRIPEHDCVAKQHYSDPGPKPYGLPGECICADWFAEGEAVHLPACPQTFWTCSCGFASWGPTCRDCDKPRPGPAPEGW